MMKGKYLLLGSNMGDRTSHLSRAKSAIENNIGRISSASHIYETAAWGYKDQPDYLNQVIKVDTGLEPEELLSRIGDIEKGMGRKRYYKWRERLIDIDILYYDNLIIKSRDLEIPHPQIPNRKFTLIPLCDIAAREIHPLFNKTHLKLLEETKDRLAVRKIG